VGLLLGPGEELRSPFNGINIEWVGGRGNAIGQARVLLLFPFSDGCWKTFLFFSNERNRGRVNKENGGGVQLWSQLCGRHW
jgi:hypothetical protein